MAVSKELIAKVLQLLPNHPTIEALKETTDLTDVPFSDIREALLILEERKKVRGRELFGRDVPPQGDRP